MEENKKEIIKRWEDLGFLAGLDEDTTIKVALEMDNVAHYLIGVGDDYPGSVSIIAFPTVRRIFQYYGGPNDKYNPMALCDKIREELRDAYNSQKYKNVDVDAEVCAIVSEYFGKNENSKPKL